MPKKGQIVVTFSSENASRLLAAYKEEMADAMYRISLSEFIAANALTCISLRRKHKK